MKFRTCKKVVGSFLCVYQAVVSILMVRGLLFAPPIGWEVLLKYIRYILGCDRKLTNLS